VGVQLGEYTQIDLRYATIGGFVKTQLYSSRPDRLQMATVFPVLGNTLSGPAPIGSLLAWPDAEAAWAQVMCQSVPHVEVQVKRDISDTPNVVGIDAKVCLSNGADEWTATELVPLPMPGPHNLLAFKQYYGVGIGAKPTTRPGFLIVAFFAQPKGRIVLTIAKPEKEATGREKDVRLIPSRALSTLRVPVPPDTAESTRR